MRIKYFGENKERGWGRVAVIRFTDEEFDLYEYIAKYEKAYGDDSREFFNGHVFGVERDENGVTINEAYIYVDDFDDYNDFKANYKEAKKEFKSLKKQATETELETATDPETTEAETATETEPETTDIETAETEETTDPTEEPTAEKQITSEELGTDDTTEETKTENVDWGYFDKFDEISGIYLPPTGEGETKATQLVTAISKLVYKWYNDGDVYDNTAYMEGWCNDLSSYANWIYANYSESQPILDRIYKVYDDAGYEHILKDLADKFLDKEFLSEENEKISYGSIYNAVGNFRFEDYETENDDDYEW